MLRFLLLTLTLCLGCALIIGAAVAVGRTQPPSEAVRWWHLTDCELPCFMGVTIGKTSYAEAKQHMDKLTAPSGYEFTYILDESGEPQSSIAHVWNNLTNPKVSGVNSLDFSNGTLYRVFFFLPKLNLPSAADIVALYGIPICTTDVQINAMPSRAMRFVRGGYSITVSLHGPLPVTWDSKVALIIIEPFGVQPQNPCQCLYWKGITSEKGYDATCRNAN